MAEMNIDEVRSLYKRLQGDWAGRNGQYDVARRRYAGEHYDAETNPAQPNRYSLTLNYLKPFVDKSVQLLVGRLPAIQVMPNGVDEFARQHAESLEGVLYGSWMDNRAPDVFYDVAWDSFVLRRGLIYVWWDPKERKVRFKHCTPDHFYPEYDGTEIWRAVYVTRRPTERLKAEYPSMADKIRPDNGTDLARPYSSDDTAYWGSSDMTTIIDVFDMDGKHTRVMGDAIKSQDLAYPFKAVPFIEFPCFPIGSGGEPMNLLDQLVELNQYLDVLVSQKADVISRYANPPILDENSGQGVADIQRAVSAAGSVIPLRPGGNLRLLNWEGTAPAIDEQITLILDAMFDLAGKPRSAFGQTVTNQSGVVTNLALTPTLQSNEMHETIWGLQLSKLNEWILMLWEKFSATEMIEVRGRFHRSTGSMKFYDVKITGEQIAGWYKNRIKWPSAIRTDDPVYVQNHLQQLQAQPVPGLSLYTYLEDMGREDVEAEIGRIKEQLQDPTFHPDRMQAAMEGMGALQGLDVGMGDPSLLGLEGDNGGQEALATSLEQGGNPNRDAMMQTATGGRY